MILAYDVEVERNRKVMRIAKKYLRSVQRSLFQGFLTEGQCERMKRELASVIDVEKDAIALYKLNSANDLLLEELGASKSRDPSFL